MNMNWEGTESAKPNCKEIPHMHKGRSYGVVILRAVLLVLLFSV